MQVSDLASYSPGAGALSMLDFRRAFDDAPIGMALCLPGGVIVRVNAALVQLLGRSAAELVGTDFFRITHVDDLAKARAASASLLDGQTVSRHDSRLLDADGRALPVTVAVSAVIGADGQPGIRIMHFNHAASRVSSAGELTIRALHDQLTGLPSRTLFLDRAEHALTRSGRRGGTTCMVSVDLDDLRSVNKSCGHGMGDRVLIEFARRLKTSIRAGDTAARIVGDRFSVLCEDTDVTSAEAIASRIRAAGAATFRLDGVTVQLSAATGVAEHHAKAGQDAAALLREADAAMYASRRRRVGRPA